MSMEMNKALDLLREIRPSIPKEVLELWCKDRDAFLASHPAVEQACGDERDDTLARVEVLESNLAELEMQVPVAFLYRGTDMGDQLTLIRLDHYWRPKYSTKEHDYIKGIPLYAAPVSQAQHSVPEGYRLIRLEHFAAIKAQLNPEQVDAYRGRNVYDEEKVYANWTACRSALDEIKEVFQQIDWDTENELAELLAAAPGKEVGHE
ncbi:hypothetical protein [Pseudomonas phage PP21]